MDTRRIVRSSIMEGETEDARESARRLKPVSKAALKKIRARLAERSSRAKAETSQRQVSPKPLPRYDEVFAEGQRWLDTLAGEPIASEEGRLSLSEDLWRSGSRGEPKLP